METFKTVLTFDKKTSKEINTALVAPFSKKMFLSCFILLVILPVLAVMVKRYELIIISVALMPFLLYSRFIGLPHGKRAMFLEKVVQLRKNNDIKSLEYKFIISFNADGVEVKDDLVYENNIIVKMNYDKFRWLIETETYYIILPKNRIGYSEWFNDFGIVNKIDIEDIGKRKEFLEFLKINCSRIKFLLKN